MDSNETWIQLEWNDESEDEDEDEDEDIDLETSNSLGLKGGGCSSMNSLVSQSSGKWSSH